MRILRKLIIRDIYYKKCYYTKGIILRLPMLIFYNIRILLKNNIGSLLYLRIRAFLFKILI